MMNDFRRGVGRLAAALGILGLSALGASAQEAMPYDSPVQTEAAAKTPETLIQNWPGRSRSTARAMIAKYGEPTRFDENSLVWDMNGPWRKTVVYRKASWAFMSLYAKNIVEQSIGYDVPDEKIVELKRFDGSIRFDRAKKELSSRAESEDLNYLALNLADEIVASKRTAAEARDFYRKTQKLSMSGKPRHTRKDSSSRLQA